MGQNARYASTIEVGGHLQIWGRVQSREYTKKISEEQVEKRVAYEVSVSKIDVVEEEEAWNRIEVDIIISKWYIQYNYRAACKPNRAVENAAVSEVEVALFISTLVRCARHRWNQKKGDDAEVEDYWRSSAGRKIKSLATVIFRWRAT